MINLAVFMRQNVALPNNFSPRDFRMRVLAGQRYASGGFSYQLNIPFYRSHHDTIGQKR
jgi:hypothetical protein